MNFKNRFITILIVFIFSALIALPTSWKSTAFKTIGIDTNPVIQWFTEKNVTLGLDLQGGTQLDYKVDLSNVPQKDKNGVMEGVKAVFERRVNGLGVSEPNIYSSSVGDEEHIIVELAGIQDINEAKKTIGKVIQLEFKEANEAQESEQKEQIRLQATETLKKVVNAPEKFETTGKEVSVKNRVEYKSSEGFSDTIEVPFKDKITTLKNNQVAPELIQGSIESAYEIVNGEFVQVPEKRGYFILKMNTAEKVLRPDPKNAEDFLQVAKAVSDDSHQDMGYVRKTAIPLSLQETVFSLPNNNVSDVLETDSGYYIYKMAERLSTDESMVRAQHILLQFKEIKETKPIDDTLSASEKKKLEDENKAIQKENDAINTYNQEELPKKADDLLAKVKANPSQFAELAKQYSEDTGSKNTGGDVGYFGRDSQLAQEFKDAALAMNINDISALVKTTFGYHIIKVTDKKLAGEEVGKMQQIRICWVGTADCKSNLSKEDAKKKADDILKRVREETKYTYEYIYYSTVPDQWKPALATNPVTKEREALTGKFFKRADVEYSESTMEPIVGIKFNDEGGKMFEEITERLTGKSLAIFVGGDLISAPNVKDKITGGSATITGNFSVDEAAQLQRDLNAGAIPAPIMLVGEQQIGAQLGSEALNASLKAGLWGVLVLILFLIVFYRLPGLVAGIALGVYVVLFMAFIKIWPGMVLTLAGIAGAILSIGMAVDANVLIFERLKEEIRAGKPVALSLKAGFERAWASIRDSNSSSILTALILLWFGSSIIKGFAFMLIAGVLLSLFSAIFVTRTLLQIFATERFMKNTFLWGLSGKKSDEHKEEA